MPDWAKRITTIGQVLVVLAALGGVTLLALEHIIDGAAAIGAYVLITGAGTAVPAAINAAASARRDTSSTDTSGGRNG